jgi:hypothetical protein
VFGKLREVIKIEKNEGKKLLSPAQTKTKSVTSCVGGELVEE